MELLLDGQETERLLFRKLSQNDINDWLPFHQDPSTSAFWSGLPKDPETACREDFERTFYRYGNQLGGKQALVLKSDKTLIGLAGLLVQEIDGQREIEVAYSLLPAFWGRGFATEAARKCKAYAFRNNLAKSLISIIHIDNIPSQNVALNNGMQRDKTTTYRGNPVYIFRVSR
tara:strand:+ start:1960 stop:2478 length:519 start_codon:yes stop_codon:yes gene_type:complete